MSATPLLTPDALMEAAEKLSPSDLDRFADRVVRLRVRRRASTLGDRESELLHSINQGLPESLWQRYNELVGQRKEATLAQEEHEELKHLTNQIEVDNASRISKLVELASIRGVSVDQLMHDLGISSPGYE